MESKFRNRIVGYGEEPVDQIMFNPQNWRIHPEKQQDSLTGVLNEVGWVQNVIINRITGHLVDGHLRVTLADRAGEKTVPVTYVDLSEDEEALILAVIDPIAAAAGVDSEKLGDLLKAIKTDDPDINSLLSSIAAENGIATGDGDAAGDGADAGITATNQYGVIVICSDEGEQERTFNELTESGYNCKVVVV